MRASMAAGNVGGALAAYKQLWERLANEYDVEPSGATQEQLCHQKWKLPPPPNHLRGR